MKVFQETIDFIQIESFNTTFTLDDVYKKMTEIAAKDNLDCYSKKSLRSKLKDAFGSSLHFVNIGSRSDILCFKSSADQIIADYHASALADDGVDPKLKFMLTTAKIFKDEAKCVGAQASDFYPSLENLDNPDLYVPDSFRWFFEALLPPKLAEIWAQCLLRQILPRSHISPFQLSNALYLKQKWNSKALNTHMARLGFAVSYKESQNFLWAWLADKVENEGIGDKDVYSMTTQYVTDNLDLDMSSINRVVSVHGTASIKVCSDEKDATTEPPVG